MTADLGEAPPQIIAPTTVIQFHRPYWQIALIQGYLLAEGEAYLYAPKVISDLLRSLSGGNTPDVNDEIVMTAPYRDWAMFLGWLSGRGVFDLDPSEISDLDQVVLDFAVAIAELVAVPIPETDEA